MVVFGACSVNKAREATLGFKMTDNHTEEGPPPLTDRAWPDAGWMSRLLVLVFFEYSRAGCMTIEVSVVCAERRTEREAGKDRAVTCMTLASSSPARAVSLMALMSSSKSLSLSSFRMNCHGPQE